ncbi:MAG TPA: trigger factor, partial [Gammaproteobacteria bacterium]|nr:trigger factor [Gammaproteobacteria bacterium]
MNAVNSKSYEVSLEPSAGLERRMTVRVPTADIERAISARLAQVGKTAKLKGFRPGKVPQKVVRQYYGGQVRDEVMTEVIRRTYSSAIAEQKLNPAGGPRIEPLAAEGQEHFAYRATFEVYPEIELKPLGDLAIEVPSVAIEDSDLDAMIEKLRTQRASWKAVERPSAEGDRVVVDFAGTIDGESFEGGEGKSVAIVVGSGQVLQDFDRALRGIQAGANTAATVLFPQDYPSKNLAGKTAAFSITVLRVEELELPQLDDEFATSFGLAGGASSLRGEVRNNMERELKERLRAEIKTRVFDSLIRANQVVVPRALVDQEIATLQSDALRQMGTSDPSQAPPRERFEALAQRRVTIGLLIQEL